MSSFLPIVYLSFYEEGWVTRSTAFWRSYLDSVDPAITISLGNTFEFCPDYLSLATNDLPILEFQSFGLFSQVLHKFDLVFGGNIDKRGPLSITGIDS